MLGLSILRAGLVLTILWSAAACASGAKPIILSASFAPPGGTSWAPGPEALVSGPCRIGLGQVRDTRSDVRSMGEIASRTVRAEDAAGWVRSGFESLNQDARIQLVPASQAVDVKFVIDVEILKAYISSVAINKTASIAVRIRYSQNGAPVAEQIIQGYDDGMNWASGDGEAQFILNSALKKLIHAADKDILARCSSSQWPSLQADKLPVQQS